ncbi:MAG: MFS transporter [Tistlia sp.]|uniref:nitrate/nitrite transporter n=1 Tax=Tistlia sp. TaxID=3057121 RepID=UPI0034A2C9E1
MSGRTPQPGSAPGSGPASGPRGELAFWITVFLPFSAGAFLSNLFRSVNAVIAPDLSAALGLGPAALGFVTAAYFVTFAGFQIPLGILLDRFGPRAAQAALLPLAALGAAVFALGDDIVTLAIGRGLIGLGVCGAVLASLKAITLWYPPSRLAFANGVFMAAGSAGALAATTPVEWALTMTDWRGVYGALALAVLGSALWVWIAVPRGGRSAPGAGAPTMGAALGAVYGSRFFWRIAPVCAISCAANLALQGLWAGPWLSDVAALDRPAVAVHLLALGAALTLGFAVMGLLADLLGRIGVPTLAVIAGGLLVNQAAQLGLALEAVELALPLWILVGLFGQFGSLGFAVLARHFPPWLAGRGLTGLSFMIFFGAFLLQYGVGALIEGWAPTPAAGAGYPRAAYQAALFGLLALQVLALIWAVLPRRRDQRRGPGGTAGRC